MPEWTEASCPGHDDGCTNRREDSVATRARDVAGAVSISSPSRPRRRDAVLGWPLEAPMMDAAVHALFREVRIESPPPAATHGSRRSPRGTILTDPLRGPVNARPFLVQRRPLNLEHFCIDLDAESRPRGKHLSCFQRCQRDGKSLEQLLAVAHDEAE